MNTMKYRVSFVQWYDYYVEADSEEEAVDIAEEDFVSDMRTPIANTTYDEVNVYEVEED